MVRIALFTESGDLLSPHLVWFWIISGAAGRAALPPLGAEARSTHDQLWSFGWLVAFSIQPHLLYLVWHPHSVTLGEGRSYSAPPVFIYTLGVGQTKPCGKLDALIQFWVIFGYSCSENKTREFFVLLYLIQFINRFYCINNSSQASKWFTIISCLHEYLYYHSVKLFILENKTRNFNIVIFNQIYKEILLHLTILHRHPNGLPTLQWRLTQPVLNCLFCCYRNTNLFVGSHWFYSFMFYPCQESQDNTLSNNLWVMGPSSTYFLINGSNMYAKLSYTSPSADRHCRSISLITLFGYYGYIFFTTDSSICTNLLEPPIFPWGLGTSDSYMAIVSQQ